MQIYDLMIKDRAITLVSDDNTLVRTSKGVDSVRLLFDSAEWLDGFDLSVAFINGETIIEVDIEPQAVEGSTHLAECVVDVPDEVLTQTGALGVTVHGSDENDNHIITARAFPLTVELEGDGEGEPPQPNP